MEQFLRGMLVLAFFCGVLGALLVCAIGVTLERQIGQLRPRPMGRGARR